MNKIIDGINALSNAVKTLGDSFNYIGGHMEEFRLVTQVFSDLVTMSPNIVKDTAALTKYESDKLFPGMANAAKENSVVQDVANSIIKAHNDLLSTGLSKLNDFNNAIGNAVNSITAGTIFSGSGMVPTGNVGGAPNGSWQKYTDYGPVIDPKGSKYYDSSSFNGRGAKNALQCWLGARTAILL
jgi:hypothetical protein